MNLNKFYELKFSYLLFCVFVCLKFNYIYSHFNGEGFISIEFEVLHDPYKYLLR